MYARCTITVGSITAAGAVEGADEEDEEDEAGLGVDGAAIVVAAGCAIDTTEAI